MHTPHVPRGTLPSMFVLVTQLFFPVLIATTKLRTNLLKRSHSAQNFAQSQKSHHP